MLLKILTYFSTSELLTTVAQVSKQFNQLTLDPSVHRHVSVDFSWRKYLARGNLILVERKFNTKFKNAAEFLKWATFMKSLRITCKTFESANCREFLLAVSNQKNLESLEVADCLRGYIHHFNGFAETRMLSKLKSLKLEITDMSSNQKYRQDFCKAIEQLRNLRRFSLYVWNHTNVSLPINWSDFSKASPDLEIFESNLYFEKEDLENFLEEKKDKLRILKLKNSTRVLDYNPPPCEESVIDKISNCHKLESLSIYPENITLLAKLSALPRLKTLRIRVPQDIPRDFRLPDNSFVQLESLTVNYGDEIGGYDSGLQLKDYFPGLTYFSMELGSK